MIAKPIDSITKEDIEALIESGKPEGKRIEYKREIPEKNHEGKVAVLKSITAFANTDGGDVIYGIAAENGIPKALAPLKIESDKVQLRFDNLLIDGAEPRVTGVGYKAVIVDGGHVLVVRVRRSWSAPHRVVTGGHNNFYSRKATGSFPMDVAELREAFGFSESVMERVRAFRRDRVKAHERNEANGQMTIGGIRVLVHLAPLASFSGLQIDVVSKSREQEFTPTIKSGWDSRLCLEGRFTFNRDKNGMIDSSVLVYRSGLVEVAHSYGPHEGNRVLAPFHYERVLVDELRMIFKNLNALEVPAPCVLMLSICDQTDATFLVDHNVRRDAPRADRRDLLIPEVMMQDWTEHPAKVMKPAFDIVWNAYGLDRSCNYENDGSWKDQL